MADFATTGDIEAQWRALTSSEVTRATALLTRASAVIRATIVGIDDRIDAGTLDDELVRGVAVDMVVRRMRGPANGETSVSTDDTTFRWETGRSGETRTDGMHLTDGEVDLLTAPARRARKVGTIRARATLQP